MYYDDVALAEITDDPNQVVKWVMFGTYSYENGKPLLTDSTFDEIGDQLIKNWHNIDHDWKDAINVDGGINKMSTVCISNPLPYEAELEVKELMENNY